MWKPRATKKTRRLTLIDQNITHIDKEIAAVYRRLRWMEEKINYISTNMMTTHSQEMKTMKEKAMRYQTIVYMTGLAWPILITTQTYTDGTCRVQMPQGTHQVTVDLDLTHRTGRIDINNQPYPFPILKHDEWFKVPLNDPRNPELDKVKLYLLVIPSI